MTITLPTLLGKTLPSFPCRLNKAPMTKNGFKDATDDLEKFRRLLDGTDEKFLFGVPTGELTDFDVLDIDLKGIDWWKSQRTFPTTLTHRTRSGGFHVLFHHRPKLRCSTSKVAPGVDVRADGGYIIWWPYHFNYVYNDGVLAEWPEELLERLELTKSKSGLGSMVTPNLTPGEFGSWTPFAKCLEILSYQDHDQEVIEEILNSIPECARSGVTMEAGFTVSKFSRESKYAMQAAVRSLNRIRGTPKGKRNDRLNGEAYGLGRIAARRWTPVAKIVRALWRGAVECKLVADDGAESVINTIISGISAGIQNPHDDLGELK